MTLYINCCPRRESRTDRLARALLAKLGDYEELRLYDEPLQALDEKRLEMRETLLAQGEFSQEQFRYARQFAQADRIVVAAPFWDLSFPALLKVYIEQVSVDGITFGSTADGLKGLCRASHLVFLTTRGGFYTGDAMEMGSRYLDALHTFFGIGEYTCIAADGMNVAGFDAETALRRAMQEAARLAASL